MPGSALRRLRVGERQRRPSYQPSPTGWALGRPMPKRWKRVPSVHHSNLDEKLPGKMW